MKKVIGVLALFTATGFLFNCSNPQEPTPAGSSGTTALQNAQSDAATLTASGLSGKIAPYQSAFRLMKTLTMAQGKGFNLLSPFAITAENAGDIGWGAYGCYAALKPVKVSFHNLEIVDVASITPAYLATLPFNQVPIANAPAGSAFWTNYMPAKTIIACKTATGKYYLVEVLADNPLAVNIYHPVRM
jgi:hypothetical protein